jgi:WD40 repeat protein
MATPDGSVALWSLATGEAKARFTDGMAVTTVRFSADGRLLLTGTEDGTVRAWTVVSSDLIASACESLAAIPEALSACRSRSDAPCCPLAQAGPR